MSLEWLLIRGSGLAAFALLALSVIWGLLITTKALGKAAKAKPVTWFHESLGIAALVATVVHLVTLGIHDFVDFTWVEVFVPGVASWRPTAVALGVISFYALAIVSLSFYIKPLIGQRAWRAVHTLSFGLYVAALAHGIMAGTDSRHPAVVAMYAGLTAMTVILMVIRMTQPAARRPVSRPARAVATHNPDTADAGAERPLRVAG